MKPFKAQREYPGIPDKLTWLMDKPKTREAAEWFLDQMLSAAAQLTRMREHYENEVKELCQRVKDLEARFLQDSHNSSQPPSSDGLKKACVKPPRTQSLRSKSAKPRGAQPGHEPHFLQQRSNPGRLVLSPVHRCFRCNRALDRHRLLQYETRQVIDLVKGQRFVIEYRAEMKLCPHCGSMNHGGFPDEARSYVCYGPEVRRVALDFMAYPLIPPLRLAEIFLRLHGIRISEGSLHRFAIQASQQLKDWENQTKRQLMGSPLVHFDETGIRSRGGLTRFCPYTQSAAQKLGGTSAFCPTSGESPFMMDSPPPGNTGKRESTTPRAMRAGPAHVQGQAEDLRMLPILPRDWDEARPES